MMTPTEIAAAGERLYGPRWRRRLAADLAVDVATLRRWTSEKVAIPRTAELAIAHLLNTAPEGGVAEGGTG